MTSTLTVTPATLTVDADSPTKVYGAALPALSYTYSGLVNGDTASVFSGALATTGTAASGVGSYPISQGTLAAGSNYSISFTDGTLTVTPATLTVDADSPTKVYGAALPALSYTYSGLVNGDTASVFSGTLATTGTAASGVGSYPISQGTLAAGSNYSISFTDGTLTVTPATLTVDADSPTKVYGAALPALSYTYSGLVNGDTASVFSGALATTGTAASGVGSYPISQGTLAAGSNYSISFTDGTLTVTPATLTVDADSPTKVYGAALPALSYTYSGLVNGDTASVFSGTLATTGTAASGVGSYPISQGTLGAGSDYTIAFFGKTLSITPAPLTVTANSATRVYGQQNPAFTVTYAGLTNGDLPSSLGGSLHFSTAATASSPVNTYSVVPGGLTSLNYAITFAGAKLVVTPAPLTITANNQSRVYGQPNPPLTVYYQGFVNGDTPASLTAPVALSTPAVLASFAGSYPIFVGGAASPNYAIRFVSGTLAIMPPTNPVVLGRIAFVTSLYRDLLLRSPGPAELFSWLQQLGTGSSALHVASAINQSPEHRAVLRSHHGVGISFAVALKRAVKAEQHAIQNARRALKAGHH